jgi:hypothetical protein
VTADTPTPLCTSATLQSGAFADLVRDFPQSTLDHLMLRATRLCESATDRRLVPFTITETQRAQMLDVDDITEIPGPMEPSAQLGFSRAQSLGTSQLVRHFWLREYPARYPEFWTGSITSINLLRSYSGTQAVVPNTTQYEQDTGHCRFQLGTYVPTGTTIVVVYSGGYTTIPLDLEQAGEFMAASLVLKQLDPAQAQHGHDPDALRLDALEILTAYTRR